MPASPDLIIRDSIAEQLPPQTLSWIRKIKGRLYDALGLSAMTESTIVLTDDEEIHELNLQWRGVDEPTDVLSFAYQEAENAAMTPDLLGDVVISIPTARRYAESMAHAEWLGGEGPPVTPWTFELELAFLLAHGFLHLMGHDHEEPEDEAIMKPLEREIFASLIAPTKQPRRAEPAYRYEDEEDFEEDSEEG